MTAYQRDDGAEMVEYRPGRTIPRELGLRLGLIAPEVCIGGSRPAPLRIAAAPLAGPAAPPLQPSFDDLAGPMDRLDGFQQAEVRVPTARAAVVEAIDPKPLRAPRPKPARRPLAAILADADRRFRAGRGRP